MKRIYQSFKGKKTKKDVIKQAEKLRAQLSREHGALFDALMQQAQRLQAAPPLSSDTPDQGEIKLDPNKNKLTVLKFIESRKDNGQNDSFTRDIAALLRGKPDT